MPRRIHRVPPAPLAYMASWVRYGSPPRIYGDFIYFLEVPCISPYGKKILLYRVRKDGTELTLLDENVPGNRIFAPIVIRSR